MIQNNSENVLFVLEKSGVVNLNRRRVVSLAGFSTYLQADAFKVCKSAQTATDYFGCSSNDAKIIFLLALFCYVNVVQARREPSEQYEG